ncbi:MAG: PAS domain S-box-containing protein [Cyclobacteriaceae bacterium]|jgi:PAS domain S-box-containing protein
MFCLFPIQTEKYHLLANFKTMDLVANNEKILNDQIERLEKELELIKSRNANLQKSEFHHLRELFDSSNDLIQIFQPNGDFKFVNEAWRNKLGYREDEIINLKFVDVLHPEHRKQTLPSLVKITAGSSIERFETVLITKYGKNIYVTGKLTCVFEGEEILEYRCIFFDITERFRAERAQALYYKIANIAMEPMSLEKLYEKIYQELKEILNISSYTVTLRNAHKKELDFAYWFNDSETESGILTKDVESLLTTYTFERAKPIIIYEDGIIKIATQKKTTLSDPLPKIWLGVIIYLENQVVGILSISSFKDQGAYNLKDLELLDFISGQISLAMERKINEEKIENQAARLGAIFESSTHEIWSIDKDYCFTSFNQNYVEAFDQYYGQSIKIGSNILERFNKSTTKKNKQFWQKKYELAFRGKTLNFQTSSKTLNGNKVWRDIFVNPIFLPSGAIDEISVIANDITEKKGSETALKESEEKFRNIFESFQDIYFRCNTEGIISMISPSVKEVLGLSPKSIIGKNITDFFISKSKISALFRNLYTYKKVRNFEGSLTTANGEKIQFISNVRLIKRKGLNFEIEGVARDITVLKKTHEELRNAKEIAERSLKVKERFLANMSHEIRTPMNGIIGMIDLIASTKLNKEQTDYIRTIKKSSDTLLSILNDILDLSKIEAGKMELRLQPVRIIETFEKIYDLYSQQANLINNTLYYHLDDQLPEYILADETRLIQVLSNLTSNAIKFSNTKGHINISIRIVEVDEDSYKFKVSVKDSGIGISHMDLEKLFKNFSQIDSSSRKMYSGTGLGLAISKELVRSMGGEINVVSTPGLGSTFSFTFKATKIEPPKIEQNSEEQILVKQFTSKSPKILLVDDNDINRRVAVSILQKSGCKVNQAANGYEAIKLVQKHPFDLIFMDIQMPDMDGVQTTHQIKSLQIAYLPPIVAMTAYSMEEDRENFLKEGLDDYVSKPIKAANLIGIVKKWLDFEPQKVITEVFVEENEDLTINQNTLNQLYKYGRKELIESVLYDFNKETDMQVSNIKKFLNNKEYEDLGKELHTLKGNAGTLGIEKLSKSATNMEKSIKENKFESLHDQFNNLLINLSEFKESYDNFISS